MPFLFFLALLYMLGFSVYCSVEVKVDFLGFVLDFIGNALGVLPDIPHQVKEVSFSFSSAGYFYHWC